ncbi:MAG: CotS family spore coat protein [Clostridia bacterium]|nr:CotS family spore coat protein [Clostridia bacterium]
MAIDISALVQEYYGINPVKCCNTREGWVIEEDGSQERLLCRALPLRGEKIIGTHVILKHLRENGFDKTDRYLTALNGLPFMPGYGVNYILIKRNMGRECEISCCEDLADASRLLAEMHLASRGFTQQKAEDVLIRFHELMYPPQERGEESARYSVDESNQNEFNFNCYIKNDLGNTPETFKRRLEELKKFRKTAKKSRNAFDYAYLSVADYYCALAERIHEELAVSPYEKLTEQYREEGCVCHRDYTGHNILLGKNETVINFESACIDLPIYDVANFLRRRMRKCGWSVSDADFILDNYSKTRPLSNDEITVLKILLQFPQKLWRIINKYYNSRRSWCEKSCLMQLEEVKQEKDPLAEFAKNF